MHSGNPDILHHAQTAASASGSAPQSVPSVDITESVTGAHNAHHASISIPQGVGSLDITEGTPATMSADAQQFYIDAVFAVQNGNVKFLELLLGPEREELQKVDDEIVALNKKTIPLLAARNDINSKAFAKCYEISTLTEQILPEVRDINVQEIEFLKAYIHMAEEFSSSDGIRKKMVEAYRKINGPQREQVKVRDDAYRARFVNGKLESIDQVTRQQGLIEYDNYINQLELAHFASEQIQKELQEKNQKLRELIDEAKATVAKLEAASDTLSKNAFEIETIKSDQNLKRDQKVSHIIDMMTNNPDDMPMPQRYKELLNQDENKALRELLMRASGARVNPRKFDQENKSPLFYALEDLEKGTIHEGILKLLIAHGAQVTLLHPSPICPQPYKFIIKAGHNGVSRLFINHHMRGIARLKANQPGFMNTEMLLYCMTKQAELLENLYNALIKYYDETLPGTFFKNAEYEQHRKELWEKISEIFSQAVAINSWFIVGDAITGIKESITLHSNWWTFNRSRLRRIFENHETEASKALLKTSSWHLIAQLQELMKAYENGDLNTQIKLENANAEIEALKKQLVKMEGEKKEQEEINKKQLEVNKQLEKRFEDVEKKMEDFFKHGNQNHGNGQGSRYTPGYESRQDQGSDQSNKERMNNSF